MSQPRPNSLSDILRRVITPTDETGPTISLGSIVSQLEHQALSVLILLFCLPNILPSPPGTSAITGTPLLFLTIQMALSRSPWLPRFIARRELPRQTLMTLLDKAEPWIHRLERAVHPRLEFLTNDTAERLVGCAGVFLSVVILLPIPFGNIAPASALAILAMGFLGRDGAWILAGIFAAGFAVALMTVVWGGAILALLASMGY